MNALLKYAIDRGSKEQYLIMILFLAPLFGGSFAFTTSYVSSTNVIVGFCLFFYVLHFEGKRRTNYVYLGLMLFLGSMAYLYAVRMFYFLSLGFYILFVLEKTKGRMSPLSLFLLLFMSPVFQHVALTFGFPIRLQLSQMAGTLLSVAGWDVKVEGNMMFLNGSNFAVDEACMGLNMLAISMLMGVFLIAHLSKTSQKSLRIVPLTMFFLVVFGLNLISNLSRIMVLVVFEVLPENPMHEVIGIVCLVFYVILPVWFISKWMMARFGKTYILPAKKEDVVTKWKYGFLSLAILVVIAGIHIGEAKENTSASHAHIQLPKLQITQLGDGISKLQNKDLLLYVKPIPEFFTGEHTPLICWKGSGYSFGNIKKQNILGNEVYTGLLKKEGSKLYTAWWYDNGQIKTIDQWDWRMRMVKGEKRFCLVNLTTNDEGTLLQNMHSLFQTKWLD